jgi:hypothetical protein
LRTVAKGIELKDPLESIGAEMVREVASKTSDLADDATTQPLGEAPVTLGINSGSMGGTLSTCDLSAAARLQPPVTDNSALCNRRANGLTEFRSFDIYHLHPHHLEHRINCDQGHFPVGDRSTEDQL